MQLMDERPALQDDYHLTQLRRLFLGMLLIILAFCFGVFFLLETRKMANVKSHSPVTATITSKTETKGKSYYTRVIIDYWRETSLGPVHCSASKNLPDWSSNYDIGKILEIFPREDTCFEPYTVAPGDAGSPTIFIFSAVSFLLLGVLALVKAYRA